MRSSTLRSSSEKATVALLVCNGESPPRSLALRLARAADWIVAADGGANGLRALGLAPDVVIGDLDSVLAGTRRAFPDALFVRVRRQDNTDLEKALDFLAVRGARSATVLGVTGKRVDFTLGNFAALWKYSSKMDLRFAGRGWHALAVRGERTIRARRGTTVSLLPLGPCRGITLRGLRYPLRNASMDVGETGLSNVVIRSPFHVRVRSGAMIAVIHQSL